MFRTSSRVLLRASFITLLALLSIPTMAPAQPQTSFEREWQAGTPVIVTGTLTLMYVDHADGRRAEPMHVVRDSRTGRSYTLRFENQPPQGLRSGTRVSVHGRESGSTIYLAAEGGTLTVQSETLGLQGATVSGDQSTLVIAANFSDKVLDPFVAGADCSTHAIADRMFTDPMNYSVDDMYRDTSGGRVSFSGTVAGPFTLPYASNSACDLGGWSSAADSAASASGVDPSAYARKVYVMPSSLCAAAGIAEVGVTPSRTWIFTCDVAHVYAHELGHNLGMNHASTASDEYGDESDPMAMTGMLKAFNAVHKVQMGWLPDTQVTPITQDGVYNLAPLSLDPTVVFSPQALSAPRTGTSDRYYVSYRHAGGGFESNVYSQYLDRVSVHRWAGGMNNSYLLAVLDVGQNYVDPGTGFSVAHLSRTDSAATVQVTMGNTCDPAAPLLSISPQYQSGNAGATLSYTVALTNNDASSCSQTTFALGHALPGGWTGSVSPTALTLDPGATGQATLAVTASATASGGTYGIIASASDGVDPAHDASANAAFGVVAGDTVAPSAPSQLAARVRSRRVYLSWTSSTDDVGVAGYQVWRNGMAIATTTATNWADGAVASGATYSYWVVAYDAAGNESPSSNSVRVQMATGGKGSK